MLLWAGSLSCLVLSCLVLSRLAVLCVLCCFSVWFILKKLINKVFKKKKDPAHIVVPSTNIGTSGFLLLYTFNSLQFGGKTLFTLLRFVKTLVTSYFACYIRAKKSTFFKLINLISIQVNKNTDSKFEKCLIRSDNQAANWSNL